MARYFRTPRQEAAGKARMRAWYLRNKAKAIAAAKAWRDSNRERKRLLDRAWLAANKERKRASDRAWYEANKDRARLTSKAWQAANRAKVNAAHRVRYHATKQETRKRINEQRRARYALRGAPESTPESRAKRAAIQRRYRKRLLLNQCEAALKKLPTEDE